LDDPYLTKHKKKGKILGGKKRGVSPDEPERTGGENEWALATLYDADLPAEIVHNGAKRPPKKKSAIRKALKRGLRKEKGRKESLGVLTKETSEKPSQWLQSAYFESRRTKTMFTANPLDE